MAVDPDDVWVADFAEADIAPCLHYWYRSPEPFMRSMGVDVTKLPSEPKMRELLQACIAAPTDRPSPILTIKYRGQSIGVHELTHLCPAESAIMHGHIWNEQHRGIGIGPYSYVAAMRQFFARFELQEIRFESPAHNVSVRRVKEKLGIVPCGEGLLHMAMLAEPVKTISYKVARHQLLHIESCIASAGKRRVN